MVRLRDLRSILLLSLIVLAVPAAFAQQTGAISGKVLGVDGLPLPGVTVEAQSSVLPQARVTTTTEAGDYRMPVLPPGTYTLSFSLAGMETRTRTVQVLLGQDANVNVTLNLQGVAESITVTAEASLVDPHTTAITTALAEEEIRELPIGQEYRDLLKLAPAVQYSEDTIRGPSAGGSGQDNVYQFDGVNVTLPLFGTLSAEPSTHDIQQVEVLKGGAKAVEFNRAAGFTIDSVSKSGTSEFKGQLSYELQSDALRGDVTGSSASQFDQTKSWTTANLGGPILKDRLFFYVSYYRPILEQTERSNVYGTIPDLDSSRNEYFGKLTFTPTSSLLFNGSYRDSSREVDTASVFGTSAPTTALDEEASFRIGILEASWVVNPRSYATFKYDDHLNETSSVPSFLATGVPSTAPGTKIDIANLDKLGNLIVPSPISGQTAYNEFIAPIIERYGFVGADGTKRGGGDVGVGSQFNDQDFFRESAQGGYDLTLGSSIAHDLHFGYKWSKEGEDLARSANGWGVLRVPGGRINFTPTGGTATPVFYQAEFTRPIEGGVSGDINIHSEYVSHNLEINDTIRWNDWTFNLGVMTSKDLLYGQGMKEDDSTLSGFVLSPGSKYKMYEIPWSRNIQPRLGVTWAYNGSDNVYASYSRYIPQANSLPRAASWDRNSLGLTTRVHFDAQGNIIGSEQVASSSGKLFVEDMDPRHTDEVLIGTAQQINNRWSARAYTRYRYSTNFWEDTNNDALVRWAPAGYEKRLYIPNLNPQRQQICQSNPSACGGTFSGSTYVIAEIDGAFTKYYEATLESDWRGDKTFVRGTYTWSHYYGNFDQDNSSLTNDLAIFIGSSNKSDGPGRQIWDNKYGDLRGDRRHILKLTGSYDLPWNGTIGAFGVYQSGQPWEAWSHIPYKDLPGFGTSTSDTDRYAEPAGSRRTPAHYQVDLNYSQRFPIRSLLLQLDLQAFNIFDKQTGYNFQPSAQSALFGRPRDFFDPRRYEVALRLIF